MNGLDISQVKQYIIEPVLKLLPTKYNSPTAVNLLAGTVLVESGGIYISQLADGPARGIFQMEGATHDDCWATFLNYISNIQTATVIKSLMFSGISPVDQLEGNLYYACAMARIKYFRAPDPLPAYDDAIGLANYHKNFYNTAGGATVVAQSKLLFQEAIDA